MDTLSFNVKRVKFIQILSFMTGVLLPVFEGYQDGSDSKYSSLWLKSSKETNLN